MGTGVIIPRNDSRDDGQRDYPLTRGPHEFIEDQVNRTPDAPALTVGSEQLSYRELNSRSNQLARFLRERGVGAESLIGVCLDRSFDSVVSLLAIFKSGGTYLPLDPRFPKDRLEFIAGGLRSLTSPCTFIPTRAFARHRRSSRSARPRERFTLQDCFDGTRFDRQA